MDMKESPAVIDPAEQSRSLDELCALTQIPKRTIRYYIQIGLLDRPIGETRAARYGEGHLRRLLQIHQLSQAGFSLARIREKLDASERDGDTGPRPGSVEQWTRLIVADGLELSINPDRAALSPPQIRAMFRETLALYLKVSNETSAVDDAGA